MHGDDIRKIMKSLDVNKMLIFVGKEGDFIAHDSLDGILKHGHCVIEANNSTSKLYICKNIEEETKR